MTDYTLILNALADGATDDATVAAALDCYREQTGCTLIDAVIEVARVHFAGTGGREIAAAQAHLDQASPIWRPLRRAVTRACANLPDGTFSWIMVTDGDDAPRASLSLDGGTGPPYEIACVLVGARWVLREADIITARRKRRAEARRRRLAL